MMESLEMDTADYRQLLFEETGEITIGLMSRDVIAGLLSTWTDNTVDWITTSGPKIFFKTILFLLILVIFRILSWISRKVVRKAIQTSSLKVSKLLERTALSVTGAAVMLFGILVALSQFGFEVGPLLAGLGVVGFIIGFALQDTLGNFAAGVMILLYRPYDVGDLIEVAGGSGKVHDMTLVATTILTLDHRTLVIPQPQDLGRRDPERHRPEETPYRHDLRDLILGRHSARRTGARGDSGEPREGARRSGAHRQGPQSRRIVGRFHGSGPGSRPMITWTSTGTSRERSRSVSMQRGLSIPFPQRDVHVIEEKATESV